MSLYNPQFHFLVSPQDNQKIYQTSVSLDCRLIMLPLSLFCLFSSSSLSMSFEDWVSVICPPSCYWSVLIACLFPSVVCFALMTSSLASSSFSGHRKTHSLLQLKKRPTWPKAPCAVCVICKQCLVQYQYQLCRVLPMSVVAHVSVCVCTYLLDYICTHVSCFHGNTMPPSAHSTYHHHWSLSGTS